MTDAPASDATLDRILTAHAGREGALLPILQDVQAEYGYVSQAAQDRIAKALNLSRAELQGVVSFYHDFRTSPGGRRTLKVCRAEACQAMGAEALAERARAKLGTDWHGTDPTGAVTLEPAYCLGLCACAPAALLDDRPVGRLDDAAMDALIAEARA